MTRRSRRLISPERIAVEDASRFECAECRITTNWRSLTPPGQGPKARRMGHVVLAVNCGPAALTRPAAAAVVRSCLPHRGRQNARAPAKAVAEVPAQAVPKDSLVVARALLQQVLEACDGTQAHGQSVLSADPKVLVR